MSPGPPADGRSKRLLASTSPLSSLHALLGTSGLLIGLFSLLSFAFGLVVFLGEYRHRASGLEGLRPAVADWARTAPVHYLGYNLTDYAERWRSAGKDEKLAALSELRAALGRLGGPEAGRSPLLQLVVMEIRPRGGASLATWPSRAAPADGPSDLIQQVELVADGPSGPPVDLWVRYRFAPEVERNADREESFDRRLLLAVVGLSFFPLLCLVYMALQARSLQERVAKEAAQAATLDLADRTCHELGNVAFVLANEGRNLASHLDLVDQFIAEEPAALGCAARRTGLEPAQGERLVKALKREYAQRGIDPAVELAGGAAMAREVCRQVAVCSNYIALTVRELDGYLKQSALPVQREPVSVGECFDDALALLGPRLEAASVRVERPSAGDPSARLRVLADRRLLVHALVNLLKNAVEAATSASSSRDPVITLSAGSSGPVAWLTVSDNGPGITPAFLPRIFEFGTSTKGAGRGRGLAIVRESIQAQCGTIAVESHAGTGTTFRIGLPIAPMPGSPFTPSSGCPESR